MNRDAEHTSEQVAGGETVLVIDDNDAVLNIVVAMLEHSGFSVLSASSGHEALEVYRAHRTSVACIALDVSMPDMSCADIVAGLRNVEPHARIWLISGHDERTCEQLSETTQAAGYLQKPFRAEALCASIRHAIDTDPARR